MQQSRKVGRPKSEVETEQVTVRLPKMITDRLRPNLTSEIRNRLGDSLLETDRDPHFVKLAGQVEHIALMVRRATGAEWHTDKHSHQVFVEALRLLIEDIPAPVKQTSLAAFDAKSTASVLYKLYTAEVRELIQNQRTEMKVPTRSLIKGKK